MTGEQNRLNLNFIKDGNEIQVAFCERRSLSYFSHEVGAVLTKANLVMEAASNYWKNRDKMERDENGIMISARRKR